MTPDEVRALLLKRAAKFAKRKGSTGVLGWCKHFGVSKGHASEFLGSKRLPTTAILDGLNLEWRICTKRRGK